MRRSSRRPRRRARRWSARSRWPPTTPARGRAADAVRRAGVLERDRLQLPAAAGARADEADDRRGPDRRGAAVARAPGSRTSSSTPTCRSTGGSSARQGASTIADLGAPPDRPRAVDGRARSSRSARSRRRSPRASTRRAMPARDRGRRRRGVLGPAAVSRPAPAACSRRPRRARAGRATSSSRSTARSGTLRFDYARLNELWYGDSDRRRPSCTACAGSGPSTPSIP